MTKYNRECLNCGSKYYVCHSCESINSWKNSCCSRECYRNYISSGEIYSPIKINEVTEVILRAGLTNKKTIDITGYDLELGKFDCSDGVTRVFEDFEYFIIPKDELKEIGQKLSTNAEEKKSPYSRRK